MAKTSRASSKAPWKRPNPRKHSGKATTHLSPAKKAAAKTSARRAGRPYPNLVDNMRMAAKTKKKTTKKKTASKKTVTKKTAKKKTTKTKTSSKKRAAKKSAGSKAAKRSPARQSAAKTARKHSGSREKDPQGGLTAAGRKAFADRDGSHLKPGVTKAASEMTPQEMRRKGSWAMRFYGRKTMPPLVDDKGQPTRHALSAHAWGEPVPKTVAAARRIAAKGERLLAHYHRIKHPR